MNHYVDGVEAFKAGSYQDAFTSLTKAVELEPDNLEFRYYLGLTYSALERYGDALGIFESIVEEEPVAFRKAYFDIAAVHVTQEDYQTALDMLGQAEAIDPEDVRVYVEKGYVFQKLKEYDRAIESFNKAKELDPEMLQVIYYDIGAVHFEAEEFDKAEEMFSKSIEIDPTTITAQNARNAIASVREAKRLRKPWYLSGSFAWSYDDNVLLRALEQAAIVSPTGEALDEGDQFQTFILNGGYKFINRKDLEIGAGYSLYCAGYKNLIENNVFGHIPNLYLQYNDHPFYLRVKYDFSYYYTGGKENSQDKGFFLTFGSDSDEKLRMHAVTPTLVIVEPHNLKSEIILSYQDKDYLDEVTPDATQYSMGIVQHYAIPDKKWYPRAGYKYGSEDASIDISSYTYHQGLLGLSASMWWNIRGDVSLTYEWIDFERSPYYSVDGERRDRKHIIALSFTKPLLDRYFLSLLYSYTRSNSNVSDNGIDPYNFEKNVCGLMIAAMF
jgi:tetratricopeptide (TPR) repeat protein